MTQTATATVLTATRRDEDEARVRALLADRTAAMRAGDADRVVASRAPDAVLYDLAAPLQLAGPAAADAPGLRSWFAGFDGPVDWELRDLTVVAGDEVAFAYALSRMSATPKGSDESFTLWFRSTFGLRKVAGEWTISHEHRSTPFKMDGSFLAELELQP